MRMKYVFVIAAVLMVSVALSGCSPVVKDSGNAKAPVAGDNKDSSVPLVAENGSAGVAQVIIGPPAVKIGDILTNPKEYDGKDVIVKGKISRECPSGCWFNLQDGNAVIYIDLLPSNIVIPQKTGSSATVTARVVREGSDVYLIGSKVEF
jgi:uncharacterized protein YceK